MLSFTKYLKIYESTKKIKIKNLIDGQGLIMFFKKDNKIFGAPEESRIVFAKLKNPDEEDAGWEDEANFSGYDLMQALQGNSVENLFSATDLPKIAILSRGQAEDALMNSPPPKNISLNPMKGTKDGIGIIALKDN